MLGAAFGLYVSQYYHAGETAQAITAQQEGHALTLPAEGDAGLIFYPGGKVEAAAYLPLLQELQADGVSCYLVEMPGNLAFLGSGRAQAVMDDHPEIHTWYMAGHSLGGAFASNFASHHPEEVAGLILLGAYRYGDYPAQRCLTIYGQRRSGAASGEDHRHGKRPHHRGREPRPVRRLRPSEGGRHRRPSRRRSSGAPDRPP